MTLIENDHLGDWSPEKDCCIRLTFRQPVRKPSSESKRQLQTPVSNSSLSQDSSHPDDLFQSRYCAHGFKPFSYLNLNEFSYN